MRYKGGRDGFALFEDEEALKLFGGGVESCSGLQSR